MSRKIIPHKVFELYQEARGKRIFTKSILPGKAPFDERIVKDDNEEYREFDPMRSKLAAAIVKGCTNAGIRKDDVVLYLGAASGTTVSHVSDIVGNGGFVFAVDIAPRVTRDLIFLCYERKNIAPVLADANKINLLKERVCVADVLYQDVAQKNQIEIFLKNVDLFLKSNGYALLAVKARSIDVTKQPKQIFREFKEKLEKNLTIIDYRELEPFQKDHCMFICKKK